MTSRNNTMEEECRDHWYGPSLKRPRRNASSKNRWSQTYASMAKRRKIGGTP